MTDNQTKAFRLFPNFLAHFRPAFAAALLALATAGVALPARAAPVATAVSVGTFDHPLYIAVAPGQPKLLFVVEQTGRIEVLRDEVQLDHAFLDLTDIVQFDGAERGLLSIAFAPDYDSSGRFYVAFNNNTGDIELDEFKRSTTSATSADRLTRRILLTIRHRIAPNHNGGQLQFGPRDGYLYMSSGDGGELTPRGEPARDLGSLLGKILRINPLPSSNRPYTVPRSNPFRDRTGARNEIYAYGLRNPWRFSFDDRDMIIADVGQNVEEEINFLRTRDVAGVNFGWPQYEGNDVFDDSRPGPDPATFPILTYDHTGGRCAVIGGYVVHDPNIPALAGRYLYGDLCTGEVRSFLAHVGSQHASQDRATGIVLPNLSGFGQGYNGLIYLAQVDGGVWRLAPAP
jgi:glucose/arabinose dehydrogenase